MQTFLSLLKIIIFVDVNCLARSQTNPLERRRRRSRLLVPGESRLVQTVVHLKIVLSHSVEMDVLAF